MINKVTAAILLGALSLVSCGQEQAKAPPVETAADVFESNFFEVTITGQGSNVILVPGLASSVEVWNETVDALSESHMVHTIQVSGFAGTPARGNAENTDILDDLANDLSRYTARLDGETAMIGHSLGGLVTLKTALRDGSAIDRIMIIDVLPYFSVLMDETATPEKIAPVAAFMKATLLGQSDEVFSARQDEALAALVKSPEDRQIALDWSVASDRTVMAQAMSEVLLTDLRGEVKDIPIRTTVLFANDPAIQNIEAIRAFYYSDYADLNSVEIIPVDGALHFIMYDQPEAFEREVSRFLEGL